MVARWVHSLAACGLVLCLSGTAGAVPTLDRPVTDDAGVLKAPAVEAISKKLVLHYDKTGVQLAVLVIRTTNKRDIADYAQEVFDLWKGGDAGTDRGALFVLAMKDRRSRLHLGYGLEAIISDRGALGMLDRLKPTLRTGAVGTAVMQLVDDLIDRTVHLVRGEPVETPVGLRMGWGFFWSIFFVALLAGLLAGLVFSVKTTDKLTLKEMKKTTPGEALHVRSRWWRTHLVWDPETGRHHSGVAWLNIIVVLFGFVVAPAWAALFVTVGGFMEPVMGTWWFVLVYGILLALLGRRSGGLASGFFVCHLAFAILWSVSLTKGKQFTPYMMNELLGCFLAAGMTVAWFFWIGKQASSARSGTYSASGYSRSSYSSSSYSSSSYSSSSYSSSSYSGGGGSSGGGGASSGW